MGNIVAIVGRPNVGKSTLFNRLTESRNAIVKEISGVTRDRLYGKGEWNGAQFSVIDTGGYVKGSDDIFEGEIRKQVEIAIQEANVIVFMVDVTTGIVDLDEKVAALLRKSKKPVFIAANKVDSNDRIGLSAEFYQFGLGDVFDLSATNGTGTGELLDEVVKHFDKADESVNEKDHLPRIAIVGRPNVGKSSLVNALTGEERNIVTNISGTTRDSINTRYNAFGFDFMLIDTAGIREGAEEIEALGIERSKEKIKQAQVVLCLADASLPMSLSEVAKWANEIETEFPDKKVLILANKQDISQEKIESCEKEYISISAKEGIGMETLRSKLVELVTGDFNLANDTIVSNIRHYDALVRTAVSLEKAKFDLDNNISADFVAMDIRQAMYDLGTITGDISTDDLLGNIFSKFCIGK